MEIFPLLVHTPVDPSGWGWALLKSGSRSLTQDSYVSGKGSSTWVIFSFPGHRSREVDQKWISQERNQLLRYRMLVSQVVASCSEDVVYVWKEKRNYFQTTLQVTLKSLGTSCVVWGLPLSLCKSLQLSWNSCSRSPPSTRIRADGFSDNSYINTWHPKFRLLSSKHSLFPHDSNTIRERVNCLVYKAKSFQHCLLDALAVSAWVFQKTLAKPQLPAPEICWRWQQFTFLSEINILPNLWVLVEWSLLLFVF